MHFTSMCKLTDARDTDITTCRVSIGRTLYRFHRTHFVPNIINRSYGRMTMHFIFSSTPLRLSVCHNFFAACPHRSCLFVSARHSKSIYLCNDFAFVTVCSQWHRNSVGLFSGRIVLRPISIILINRTTNSCCPVRYILFIH